MTDVNDNGHALRGGLRNCGLNIVRKIGGGSFGTVYSVTNDKSELLAFKHIISQIDGIDGLNEINVLASFYHPHIMWTEHLLTNKQAKHLNGIGLTLPLADFPLFDIICNDRFTIRYKLITLFRIVSALKCLHDNNILHLDIKAENVVMRGKIEDTNPMLIDFGLSMMVDDVARGREFNRTLVTIDHRAPEILAGGRVYNGAVDIWSLGTMFLYILRGGAIYDIDILAAEDADMLAEINRVFGTNRRNYITLLLQDVHSAFRDQAVDLLDHMLDIDPVRRYDINAVISHELFANVNEVIECKVNPHKPVPYRLHNDFRDIMKVMVHWACNSFKMFRAEVLFLAIDLLYRCADLLQPNRYDNQMLIAAVCLWIACKVVMDDVITPVTYMVEAVKDFTEQPITSKDLLCAEIDIISELNGIIYRPYVYSNCSNLYQLKVVYDLLISREHYKSYPMWDLNKLIEDIGIGDATWPQNKDITIGELLGC